MDITPTALVVTAPARIAVDVLVELAAAGAASAVAVPLPARVVVRASATDSELNTSGSTGANDERGGLLPGSFGTAGTIPITFADGAEPAEVALAVPFDLARLEVADAIAVLDESRPPPSIDVEI